MINKINDLVSLIPANIKDTGKMNLDVKSCAGRINLEGFNAEYFYWFFESRTAKGNSNVSEIPIVIWLNGGPGSSSSVGLFLENGPFKFSGDNLISNPFSWNEKVHLMYWDQPVGTGYTTGSTYVKSETEISEIFYQALVNFFDMHKEYVNCPLYITGESYAGKYVPYIASQISKKGLLNFQGLAIGDGWMKPKMQIQQQIIYGYEMGFLDSKEYAILNERFSIFSEKLREIEHMPSPTKQQWREVVEFGNSITQDILSFGGNPDIYDVRRWSDVSLTTLKTYLNMPAVKEILHVPENVSWKCSDDEGLVYENLIADNMIDVPDSLFLSLLEENKVLFYTGNFDMSCGYTGTEIMLDQINFNGEWNKLPRKIWGYKGGLTFGYTKTLGNLSQAVIPNAGHLVPVSKPQISKEMLYTWIFNDTFPGYYPLTKKELEEPISIK